MKKILIIVAALAAFAGVFSVRGDNSRTSKTELSRNLTIFHSLVKELQANYVDTLDARKMIRTAIDAMLYDIDPYTEYFSEEETENLLSISSGQFSGIGAYLLQRDGTIVHELTPGAPAHLAGLRPGDKFLEIDGVEITPAMSTSDVSKRLRGSAGSTVKVKMYRPYVEDSILSFDIVRRTITVNPMPYYGVDSTGVGYICLTTFNEHSASSVRNALFEMEQTGRLKGLVLDLRGNGGGIIDGAIGIVGLFVPKGTEVLRTRGYEPNSNKVYKTTKQPVDTKLPLVVLIDGGTASASEIVAGSLQDLDRAVIIGGRSFGKGLVQSSRPLPYNSIIKLTTAKYYIPSGRLIQAIDYAHRDADGSAVRIPDSLTRVWHTAHGREVRDGCGISPDIEAGDTVMNRLLYNVLSDFWAFDYANRFAARTRSIPDVDSWELGDSIFNDFKAFIDPARFKYDRMCQSGIDYLRTAARVEGYETDSVMAQIAVLERMMRHDLDHDLNFNREHLVPILDSEISSRFYNEADATKRKLRYDAEIDSARTVLLDRARYRSILNLDKKQF